MASSPTRRTLAAVRSPSLLAILGLTVVALVLALVLALLGLVEIGLFVLLAATLLAVALTAAAQHRRDTMAASRTKALAAALSRVEESLSAASAAPRADETDLDTHGELSPARGDGIRGLEEQAGLLRARAIDLRNDIAAIDPARHFDLVRSDLHAVAERIEHQAHRRQTAMERLIKEVARGLSTKAQLDDVGRTLDHVASRIKDSADGADGLASAEDIELLLAQLMSTARRGDG